MPIAPHLTSAFMLVAPWALFLVGLLAGIGADNHARAMRRLVATSAWLALVLAVLAALSYGLGTSQSVPYISIALPAGLGALSLSVYVNALTVVMLLLVAFVGVIVARYSSTYMEGDAHEGRFHRWLSLTLASFLTLIATGNTWGFVLASIATSLSLNKLLAFYRDRPGAVIAARKKSASSKVADASMLTAFILIAETLHVSEFTYLTPVLASIHGSLPAGLQIAGGLIVLSAILKSAQFPFHGWLVQVMEAPTPVSAILHAGIIYTGAFLVLRASPIISRIVWAEAVLVLVGLLSISVASLMMMTSTNIKGSLAYSTCAQLGFMLMECGLGLYSLAVLHVVSHSVYKAHAFLASGSVVDHFRVPALPAVSKVARLWEGALGLVAALLVTIGIGAVFGVGLSQQPALIVMGLILAVAITHLLLQTVNVRYAGRPVLLLWMGAMSAIVLTAYFSLHTLFTIVLSASLPSGPMQAGAVQNVLLVLVGLVFVALLSIQQMLYTLMRKPLWQAIYVHLYNGLYIDIWVTRLVRSFGALGTEGATAEPVGTATRRSSEVGS